MTMSKKMQCFKSLNEGFLNSQQEHSRKFNNSLASSLRVQTGIDDSSKQPLKISPDTNERDSLINQNQRNYEDTLLKSQSYDKDILNEIQSLLGSSPYFLSRTADRLRGRDLKLSNFTNTLDEDATYASDSFSLNPHNFPWPLCHRNHIPTMKSTSLSMSDISVVLPSILDAEEESSDFTVNLANSKNFTNAAQKETPQSKTSAFDHKPITKSPEGYSSKELSVNQNISDIIQSAANIPAENEEVIISTLDKNDCKTPLGNKPKQVSESTEDVQLGKDQPKESEPNNKSNPFVDRMVIANSAVSAQKESHSIVKVSTGLSSSQNSEASPTLPNVSHTQPVADNGSSSNLDSMLLTDISQWWFDALTVPENYDPSEWEIVGKNRNKQSKQKRRNQQAQKASPRSRFMTRPLEKNTDSFEMHRKKLQFERKPLYLRQKYSPPPRLVKDHSSRSSCLPKEHLPASSETHPLNLNCSSSCVDEQKEPELNRNSHNVVKKAQIDIMPLNIYTKSRTASPFRPSGLGLISENCDSTIQNVLEMKQATICAQSTTTKSTSSANQQQGKEKFILEKVDIKEPEPSSEDLLESLASVCEELSQTTQRDLGLQSLPSLPVSSHQNTSDDIEKSASAQLKRSIVILREMPSNVTNEDISALFEESSLNFSSEFAGNGSWYVIFNSADDAHIAYRHLQVKVKTFMGKPIKMRMKLNTCTYQGKKYTPSPEPNALCNSFQPVLSPEQIPPVTYLPPQPPCYSNSWTPGDPALETRASPSQSWLPDQIPSSAGCPPGLPAEAMFSYPPAQIPPPPPQFVPSTLPYVPHPSAAMISHVVPDQFVYSSYIPIPQQGYDDTPSGYTQLTHDMDGYQYSPESYHANSYPQMQQRSCNDGFAYSMSQPPFPFPSHSNHPFPVPSDRSVQYSQFAEHHTYAPAYPDLPHPPSSFPSSQYPSAPFLPSYEGGNSSFVCPVVTGSGLVVMPPPQMAHPRNPPVADANTDIAVANLSTSEERPTASLASTPPFDLQSDNFPPLPGTQDSNLAKPPIRILKRKTTTVTTDDVKKFETDQEKPSI